MFHLPSERLRVRTRSELGTVNLASKGEWNLEYVRVGVEIMLKIFGAALLTVLSCKRLYKTVEEVMRNILSGEYFAWLLLHGCFSVSAPTITPEEWSDSGDSGVRSLVFGFFFLASDL